ncbi:putative RNase H-like nuclease [Branchiibius hedensis]|uniref:Predicted nuclease (RNAse H fold) n=1 Tax=Branchiibius hedensis TaxID=672460 RepID=A0A2Y8ZRZ3_9MICO|nr:DUF429 domain-containing protein [Branchiibius hedensis]PWJ24262.1 putative RNase H-like nuclease [Branchiibius hedensis]SSA33079.1 Predicted nuclease (RNAse H fold) [Branchiibius hedensis]
MHFIGIDLAWGERNPSGVAVLDEAGALVHLSAARTDDEIVEAIQPYLKGGVVVGIDAPLVVTNATGNRAAEQALNRDFARFDAGAHPVNAGIQAFADGTRGGRISARLGLDLNPDSTKDRRAVEVYPHPATVALFKLGRTLKYKNKQGRSLSQLREEMRTLLGLLESLATATPPLRLIGNDQWRAQVAAVESATTKAQLRGVEDQVDAVICAYVVLYRQQRPGDTTTYGEYPDGYIVTPTLPTGLSPSPRPPRVAGQVQQVRRAVAAYEADFPAIRAAAAEATEVVTGILDDAGLNYLSVTGRAKSVASFAEKAARTADGVPLYDDPLGQIHDTIGLRVITYVPSDVAAVAELLAEDAVVLDDRDMGRETASQGRFGYASRHLSIRLSPEDQLDHPAVGQREIQVQIRTVLQHAWAEFEHDIRYKGTVPEEFRADFDRRFTLAAGLIELADQEFATIRERLQEQLGVAEIAQKANESTIAPRELAAFLAGEFHGAAWSRPEHYAWIAGLVESLGIANLADLATAIRAVDAEAITRQMGYRRPSGAVRRLDDILLASYGEEYVTLPGNAHRRDRLRARLSKLTDQR